MIYVVGDSHSLLFRLQTKAENTPLYRQICTELHTHPDFTVYYIGPATAYNIYKAQSSNRSFEKIQFLIQSGALPAGATVLLALGEIDMRAHVYKQVDASPGSLQRTIAAILANYFLLVDHLRGRGFAVICYGPPASMPGGRPADPRFPARGTEQARNRATEMFTEGLRAGARRRQLPMFSLFPYMINADYSTRPETLIDGCHILPGLCRLAFKLLNKELAVADF